MKATSNLKLAAALAGIIGGMVLLTYASVPLYRIFCQITGFGGTTQVASTLPDKVLDREMTIRFNADLSPELPWEFEPTEIRRTVRVGENALTAYHSRNLSRQPVTGMATYNVTPVAAGRYFHKIQCFCFDQQTLAPNADIMMPVSFFIDPAIADDPEMQHVSTITLSYTFFKVEDQP